MGAIHYEWYDLTWIRYYIKWETVNGWDNMWSVNDTWSNGILPEIGSIEFPVGFCKAENVNHLVIRPAKAGTESHLEELLQYVSDFIYSKHCEYKSKGLKGVKRSERLWEIQNYPLPGRPYTYHWVKSKTICHFLRNFDAFFNEQWVFLNFS